MIERAVQHGRNGIVRLVLFDHIRVDGTAVDSHTNRTVVVLGNARDVAHLVLPVTFAFVMVKVTRVVANLVNMRRDDFRQPIVFLQVHGQVARGLLTNFRQRLRFLPTVDGNPHDVSAGREHIGGLSNSGVDVGGLRGRHALHGNWL